MLGGAWWSCCEMPVLLLARFSVSILLLSALSLLLSACTRSPRVDQQQFLAMGTLVDISLYGVDAEQARVGVSAVRDQMLRVEHDWHAWRPGRLTRINTALQAGRAVTLTDAENRIMQQAMTLSARSQGLFNPAIGKLVSLWGFHSDVRPAGLPPPSSAAIARLVRQHPEMSDLSLQGHILRSRNPALQLDFGGFAKGIAIDAGIAALKRLGIDNAIVNAGGDMRVIGSKGGQAWSIGVKHPRAEGVIASIRIKGDESIYTSGDYERYFDYQGRRYHHIIDPRSGMPAPGVTSVTVICRDAALAEAADKALFIAGSKGFADMAARMHVDQAMLIDTAGKVYLTSAMAKRIHFEVTPPPQIEVAKP